MSDSFSTAPLVLVLLLGVIPTVAVYVWTALALSAVFAKIGQETWRAWVPIVNQVTLLMVAGMSGWLFLLVLIPVLGTVAFWAATVVAVHRINRAFGLGGGMTVLAAVLFPVWASVVGFGVARWQKTDAVSAPAYARIGRDDGGASDDAIPDGDALAAVPVPVPVAAPGAAQTAAVADEEPAQPVPASQQVPSPPPAPTEEHAPAPTLAAASAWAPPPRVPTAPVDRVAVAAVAPADDSGSGPVSDSAGSTQHPDGRSPDPDPVPWAPAPTPTPDPVARATPSAASFDQRWASGFDEVSAISQPPQGEPVPARPVATGMPALMDDGATGPERARTGDTAPPHAAGEPVADVAPAALGARVRTAPVDIDPALRVTRAPAAPRRDVATPGPEFPLDTDDEVSAVAGAPVAGAPRAARDDVTRAGTPEDFVDQTVIARRRRVVWALQPASGPAIDLTADVVILGRQPASDPAYRGAQLVAVPDDTRTVSKTHARLELRGDRWRITDLGSTNGVMLPTLMGTEVEAEPGAELAPGERFLLGDAAYRLVRTDG